MFCELCTCRHHYRCVCCSLLTLTLVACLTGAGLSVCLKFIGPEADLTQTVTLKQADSPQLLSDFPLFCDKVSGLLMLPLPNVTTILYLATGANEENTENECILEPIADNLCVLGVPLNIRNKLYVRTEPNSGEITYNGSENLSLSCTSRVWLYAVLSLGTFLLLTLGLSVCLCCCVCICCRRKRVEEENNLFIYTPLLNSADQAPDTNQHEHSLMVGSVNTPDGAVSTLQPTELSSSYKYSSFKPGTKPGGSMKRVYRPPKKQPSPKRSYATISGTYTFNTFKPED